MPKLNDFLKDILSPLKLNNAELDAVLGASALKDFDIPDLVTNKFNENYLTLDRAAADEKVLAKARGAVYSMVEQRLSKKVKGKLKEEDQKAYDDAPQLFDKIDLLDKAIDNVAATPADDIKKVQDEWRKKEAEFRGTIKTLEDAAKTSEQNKKAELDGMRLDFALRSKLGAMELAPEFSDDVIKESLANSNIDFLKKNFVLEFDSKNPSVVNLRKSVEGAIVDVYEYEGKPKADKSAYTLDDVVTMRYDKFKKKNNADADKDKDKPKPDPMKLPTDKPLSLSDMHRA